MSLILWAVPILQLLMNKNDSFILLNSRETLLKKRRRYAFHEIISQIGIYSEMKSDLNKKVQVPCS